MLILSMNLSHYGISENKAKGVCNSHGTGTRLISYIQKDHWVNTIGTRITRISFIHHWECYIKNCGLKWPWCWTEKRNIYTCFMWECHLLIISSTTSFTDLLQSHHGTSQTGSLFCFSHPGTLSCSWSVCHYRGRKDHLHWKGCGSAAWLDLTGSSGLQWLGLL